MPVIGKRVELPRGHLRRPGNSFHRCGDLQRIHGQYGLSDVCGPRFIVSDNGDDQVVASSGASDVKQTEQLGSLLRPALLFLPARVSRGLDTSNVDLDSPVGTHTDDLGEVGRTDRHTRKGDDRELQPFGTVDGGDTHRVVVDSPSGIRSGEVNELLENVDAVLIPVLPSAIDFDATQHFLIELAELPKIKRGKVPVVLIANRLKPWTTASQQAVDDLKKLPFPVLAQLRDTQGYVLVASMGKSIFDYNSEIVRSHQEDWGKLLRWLKKLN